MKGIRTEYIELQDGRVNRNEWESLLGRLDAVGDEINRALNWSTRIEEQDCPHSKSCRPRQSFDYGLLLTYQQPNRNPLKEEYHEIEHEGQGGRHLSRSKG